MKIKLFNKQFNFLLKSVIVLIVFYNLFSFVKDKIYFNNLNALWTNKTNFYLLIPVIFLMLINWAIEAFKYKNSIKIFKKISFFESYKSIFSANFIALASPNRIADIPSRALRFNSSEKKKIIVISFVNSFSQLMITFLFGSLSYIFLYQIIGIKQIFFFSFVFYILNLIILVKTVLLLLFPKYCIKKLRKVKFSVVNKVSKVYSLLDFKSWFSQHCLSLLRYLVFFIQFILINHLLDYNYHFQWIHGLVLCLYFFLYSLIPTFILIDMGIRVTLSYYLFYSVSPDNASLLTYSILILWLVNVALSSLIGLFYLKKVKIVA